MLADAFGSVEAIATASPETLEAVPEVGPVMAASVHDWFHESHNQALIAKLAAAGLRMTGPARRAASGEQPLAGKTFVLTGTLPGMSRDEAAARIRPSVGRSPGR